MKGLDFTAFDFASHTYSLGEDYWGQIAEHANQILRAKLKYPTLELSSHQKDILIEEFQGENYRLRTLLEHYRKREESRAKFDEESG